MLQDTSFITGDPCGPPCWRNIVPGETTWNEAISIIEGDSTLNDLETNSAEDGPQMVAGWGQEGGDGCCQMYTEDGLTVSFLVLQVAPDVLLGQMIEMYGEPEFLVAETLSDGQGVAHLIYPEIPMVVYAFIEGEQGELTVSSEVVGVGYMTEDLMQLVIDTTEPGLHAWEGYQTYQYYEDGELEVTPSATLIPSD